MSEVGPNVKAMRLKKNISQNRLAKLAGISQSALSTIESSVKNPSSVTVELLAQALGCTTAELLGEAPDQDAFTPAEQSLVMTYRALTPQGQEYVRQQLAIARQLYSGEPATFADLAK